MRELLRDFRTTLGYFRKEKIPLPQRVKVSKFTWNQVLLDIDEAYESTSPAKGIDPEDVFSIKATLRFGHLSRFLEIRELHEESERVVPCLVVREEFKDYELKIEELEETNSNNGIAHMVQLIFTPPKPKSSESGKINSYMGIAKNSKTEVVYDPSVNDYL